MEQKSISTPYTPFKTNMAAAMSVTGYGHTLPIFINIDGNLPYTMEIFGKVIY